MTEDTGLVTMEVPLVVDGLRVTPRVRTTETLLQTLRERLGHTAPRGTCQIGVCGTCTVLVDGKVASSCIMLTAQARDREITTSAGAGDGGLAQVQDAFIRAGAFQCSFCIPAMTLAVHGALNDPAIADDVDGVREYLAGNLCRCGTYPQILDAVADLVDRARSEKEGN